MTQPAPTPRGAFAARRGTPRLRSITVALTLLPFVVSALVLLVDVGGDYHPYGDQAVEELHTRDVGRHPVLIGLWSRDGWSHPGPSLFYLLALPYRIVGGSPVGLAIGALLINAAAVGGMAGIAWRRGGMPLLLLTCLGCSVLMRALGADFLRDFWVPFIPVLPFGLLLYLTWSMVCGDAWALPVAVAVGSFVIQTHVGYLPLATPLVAGGAIALVWQARGGRPDSADGASEAWRHVTRAGIIALAVGVLMWLPPLIEQLVHQPGNLSKITSYFRRGGAAHTVREGYHVVASQFAVLPDWMTGRRHSSAFTGGSERLASSPPPVLVLPVAGAAILLWRRRARGPLRLMAVLSATAVLGALSVMRTIGVVFTYRLLWSWMLATVAVVVTLWAAWLELMSRHRQHEPTWIARLLVSAVFVLAVVNSASAARAGTPQQPETSNLAALLPPVTAAVRAGDGGVVVRSTGTVAGWYAWGLMAGLGHHGINAVRSGPGEADIVGEGHVHRRGPVRKVLTVAADEQVDIFEARHELRRIAYAGTLPARERADVVRRLSALVERHRAGRASNIEYFSQSVQLSRRLGVAVAVYVDERSPP